MKVGRQRGQLHPFELERRLNLPDSDPAKLTTVLATDDITGRRLLNGSGLALYRLAFNILDLAGYEIVRGAGRSAPRRVIEMVAVTHSLSSALGPGARPHQLELLAPQKTPGLGSAAACAGDVSLSASTSPPRGKHASAEVLTDRNEESNGLSMARTSSDTAALGAQMSALTKQVGHLTALVETLCVKPQRVQTQISSPRGSTHCSVGSQSHSTWTRATTTGGRARAPSPTSGMSGAARPRQPALGQSDVVMRI